MDIKELEQIISILQKNGVTEFELEQDGTSLKLTRGVLTATTAQQVETVAAVPVAPAPAAAAPAPSPNGSAPAEDEGLHKVESPIVGTFYRKPSPDSDAFVDVGTAVKKGDTLCIVEAMKLMNEIEAPVSGVIKKIMLDDAAVVEYGETLFLIDPS